MSNVFGNKVKVSIFGESHGNGIGIVIDGLPVGFAVDFDEISRQMQRRAPGNSALATPRKEEDIPEILSGIFNGKTTGAPICAVIKNTNTKSHDYTPQLLRPGHADFTAYIKYGGNSDYRGGGHFSGRITAPLNFAGALARQILSARGITIGAHIKSLENICGSSMLSSDINADLLNMLNKNDFPLLDESLKEQMVASVLAAKNELDSVGGVIECAAVGLPIGLGSPFFESMESRIAHMMFSIPAIKGIEFGCGFNIAQMRGSKANDEFYLHGESIKTKTNNNGGINGGITNGMPIVFSVAVKPTPSIARLQSTVNIVTNEETAFSVQGRHDPCIVQRAVCVIENALALCLLDAMESDL